MRTKSFIRSRSCETAYVFGAFTHSETEIRNNTSILRIDAGEDLVLSLTTWAGRFGLDISTLEDVDVDAVFLDEGCVGIAWQAWIDTAVCARVEPDEHLTVSHPVPTRRHQAMLYSRNARRLWRARIGQCASHIQECNGDHSPVGDHIGVERRQDGTAVTSKHKYEKTTRKSGSQRLEGRVV